MPELRSRILIVEDEAEILRFVRADARVRRARGVRFGAGELLARVRAQLRRHRQQTPDGDTIISFGEVQVDLVRRVVEPQGEALHLTPIEHKLLTHLATQPDRVITHQQLLKAVWGRAMRRTRTTCACTGPACARRWR